MINPVQTIYNSNLSQGLFHIFHKLKIKKRTKQHKPHQYLALIYAVIYAVLCCGTGNEHVIDYLV